MDPESLAALLEGGSEASIGDAAVFGVVTVSDRASAGTYSDLSGPAILQFFNEAIKSRCGPSNSYLGGNQFITILNVQCPHNCNPLTSFRMQAGGVLCTESSQTIGHS